MAHSSDSDSSLDALPRHLRARCLRRLMRQQLVELLRAPARRSRRGKGRASRRAAARKAARAASSDSSTLATRRGPPVMPDVCTAPERILVQSPRHCPSHGWTARVRLPQEMPPVVTAFCHNHGGWANFARRDEDSSSEELDSPRREPSPGYTPATPPRTSSAAPPVAPPEFLLRGIIAAHRGAPPFYLSAGEGSNSTVMAAPPGFAEPELAPPPPPPVPMFPGCQCSLWPTPHHQDRACPGQDERRRQGKSPLTLW
jgi:hypothetical protein